MKSKKRSLLWAVILFLVFAVASPASMTQVQAKKAVKAKSVTLNRKNVTLEKGKKLKLKATVKPKKATQKKIVWSSGNKNVATVSSKGVVKAKKKGTAKITAKIKGTKKKAVCKVKVKEPAKKPANNNNSNNNNSNNNNSNQEQKGNTINNSNTQNTNKNITSVLGENNSKTTNGSLPKTGVTQWLYVLGGVLIVAGIVSYIKYNKYKNI